MERKRKRLKEAKAEKAARKRKIRRRKRVAVLFAQIFIFLILLAIGYVLSKYEKIKSNDFDGSNIIVNEGVSQEGYTTIVLFGADSREGQLGSGTHADTMMIASIDNHTKDVKIVSVYRDTPMKQENGEITKANHAYFVGGPQAAINMLNRNLDLAIQDYVTVDFKVLADLIDLLGGIEVEISEAERLAINQYIWETALVAGREINYVSKTGVQTLDGIQAVTYARIRKDVGGDYARTERQQLVVQKLVEKIKQTDLITINALIDEVFSQVSTSFTFTEIIKLSSGMLLYDISASSGFPFEKTNGTIEGIGSIVTPIGFVENVQELHEFLYSNEDYVPSKTVQDISDDIAYLTGCTRDDYDEMKAAGLVVE